MSGALKRDEWETVRLGDVFIRIKNGVSIKQGGVEGGYPITRIETISDGSINREKMGYAGITDLKKYEDYVMQDGDILMSHINSEKHLGKSAVYSKFTDEMIIHGMNLLLLRVNSAILNNKYAYYYFLSNRFKSQLSTITKKSVNQASFSIQPLKTLEIPLPPLDVQRRIADTLDKVTELITLRKTQLKKLDELVKARFVEMFGDPVLNPYNWDVVTIGDIVTDVKYGTSKPAVDGGKYPYLRMNNLTYDGHLDLSDMKYIDIPDNEIEKCIVRKGDVLFNRTNSIELVGKTCVFDLDDEMVIAGYIIRVRLNEKLLPIVLSSYMNSTVLKEQLRNMAKGAVNQANINAQELQSIKIYLPPLELQEQFATFVEQTDKSKSIVQQSLGTLETLKKSLMQEYFG